MPAAATHPSTRTPAGPSAEARVAELVIAVIASSPPITPTANSPMASPAARTGSSAEMTVSTMVAIATTKRAFPARPVHFARLFAARLGGLTGMGQGCTQNLLKALYV